MGQRTQMGERMVYVYSFDNDSGCTVPWSFFLQQSGNCVWKSTKTCLIIYCSSKTVISGASVNTIFGCAEYSRLLHLEFDGIARPESDILRHQYFISYNFIVFLKELKSLFTFNKSMQSCDRCRLWQFSTFPIQQAEKQTAYLTQAKVTSLYFMLLACDQFCVARH